MDPGLAALWLSRLLALLATLFTALLTAGAFAFVGSTEPVYQSVSVRNKVVPATRGNYIDFRQHISPDGLNVSATFHLLFSPSCVRSGYRTKTTYARTNDLHNLNDTRWSRDDILLNSTCINEENGFVEEILDTEQFGLPTYGTEDCIYLMAFAILDAHADHTPPELSAFNGSCPYRDPEVRCSVSILSDNAIECIVSIRVQDDFGGFTLFHLSFGQERFVARFHVSRRPEREDAKVLESMAFIASMMPEESAVLFREAVTSRVEENATVQKVVGERNVTQVNVGLILATLTSAMALLLAVAIVAAVMWVRVVWLKGRRGYNSFNSNEDALASAAETLRWHNDCGTARAEEEMVVRGLNSVYVSIEAG
ncbi:hypothetical protein FGB62_50g215 [Gracilaria domingensis]|nr:hypothetical protein FGB62_50g215 [Gracilaria domingensis]